MALLCITVEVAVTELFVAPSVSLFKKFSNFIDYLHLSCSVTIYARMRITPTTEPFRRVERSDDLQENDVTILPGYDSAKYRKI